MKHHPYRLAARLSAAVLLACAMAAPAAHADDGVRLSWQEFIKDPKRLESFRRAVAVMKSRNGMPQTGAQFRTSWTYWANMHGYYGPESPFGTIEQVIQRMKSQGIWDPSYQQYFDGVPNMTPPDAVARAVWAQCQHGTPWFYAWHRLYLYYFERQLQAAAQDSSLRLPYWDYTDPANLALPAEFRAESYVDGSGKTVPNPLFERRRAPGVQDGSETLDAKSTDIDNYLRRSELLGPTGYQTGIERNVHGYVHCTVAVTCPVTDMGAVPYSSNDPIFWLHHANIDRSWSCWLSEPGHRNPDTTDYNGKQFSFIDAAGEQVTNKVSDLFDGSLIDYRYQQQSNCERSAAPRLRTSAANVAEASSEKVEALLAKPQLASAPAKALSLDRPQKRLNLQLPATKDRQLVRSLALRGHSEVPTRVELRLKGVHYKAHPGTMFDVYLERRDGKQGRAFVGTLNFFADETAMPGHAMHGLSDNVFDATDALRSLAGPNADLKDVDVVFEATTGRLGKAQKPRLTANSGLVIDQVELGVVRTE